MDFDKEGLELKKIREYISLAGRKILEIGCGEGRITEYLLEDNTQVTAIDPSEESIQKAKSKIKNVTFLIGNGEILDFAEETFDAAVFAMSLHHQDPTKALKEAYRVLKNDGKLLIIEPDVDGEVSQLFWVIEDETDVVLQARRGIQDSLFQLVKKESFAMNWFFDDFDQLCSYFLSYYSIEDDQDVRAKFSKILHEKVTHKPIVTKEKVSIFLFSK